MSNCGLVRSLWILDLGLRTANLMKSKFENPKWRWVKSIKLIEFIPHNLAFHLVAFFSPLIFSRVSP